MEQHPVTCLKQLPGLQCFSASGCKPGSSTCSHSLAAKAWQHQAAAAAAASLSMPEPAPSKLKCAGVDVTAHYKIDAIDVEKIMEAG
eukprot:1154253-Pelagomonas_calceolata.AAC.1